MCRLTQTVVLLLKTLPWSFIAPGGQRSSEFPGLRSSEPHPLLPSPLPCGRALSFLPVCSGAVGLSHRPGPGAVSFTDRLLCLKPPPGKKKKKSQLPPLSEWPTPASFRSQPRVRGLRASGAGQAEGAGALTLELLAGPLRPRAPVASLM